MKKKKKETVEDIAKSLKLKVNVIQEGKDPFETQLYKIKKRRR